MDGLYQSGDQTLDAHGAPYRADLQRVALGQPLEPVCTRRTSQGATRSDHLTPAAAQRRRQKDRACGTDESDHYLTARRQGCCHRDAHQRACASQSYQGNYVAVDVSRAMASHRQVHHQANHGVQTAKSSHLSADG